MKQEDGLCDEVETVREFTYLGDRVSGGGGCWAGATASTRCWFFNLRECGELLCGKMFSRKLK